MTDEEKSFPLPFKVVATMIAPVAVMVLRATPSCLPPENPIAVWWSVVKWIRE